jgi:hypothetical protein
MGEKLKILLLAGMLTLPSCTPLSLIKKGIESPREYFPSEQHVSPKILQELSDSINSYSGRLRESRKFYSNQLDQISDTASANVPRFPQESWLLYNVNSRLQSLGRVRSWLDNFDNPPLNEIEKARIEIAAEQFIKTSNYADVNPMTSDLELVRQTGTWGSNADIIRSRRKRGRIK